MSTDTQVQQLVINKLSQTQYDGATKNPNELYLITDKTPQTVQNMSQTVDSSTTKYPSDYAVNQAIGKGVATFKAGTTTIGTFNANATSNVTLTFPGVQNNLTSTSTTDALSANQGRLLNTAISGKEPTVTLITNAEIDAMFA